MPIGLSLGLGGRAEIGASSTDVAEPAATRHRL